jgi:hypothetical protein
MDKKERDEIARGAIERALQNIITDRQAELEAANEGVVDARAQLRAWRKQGQLERLVALRALAIAQIDDLSGDPPAGQHLEALQAYLAEHHPPLSQTETPNGETADR